MALRRAEIIVELAEGVLSRDAGALADAIDTAKSFGFESGRGSSAKRDPELQSAMDEMKRSGHQA